MIEIRQRAAGGEIGDQHRLFGVQKLRRLGHEMHAGEDDHIGLDMHRLARQRQAVADNVGDAMENLRRLVIMREHHRIAAALQRHDGVDIGGVEGPLDCRNGAAHPRIKAIRFARQRRGPEGPLVAASV